MKRRKYKQKIAGGDMKWNAKVGYYSEAVGRKEGEGGTSPMAMTALAMLL